MSNAKEAIINTAIDFFSRKGFHETSLRQLSSAVGIKVSSIYCHFKRKEAILEEILQYYKDELNKIRIPDDRLEEVIGGITPAEFLKRGFKKVQSAISTSKMDKIVQILLIEMYRNPAVREFYIKWYFDENRNSVKSVFNIMKMKGQMKNYDPESVSVLYNALINFYYQEFFLFKADNKDTTELERRFENQIDLFINMIRN
jgi:AcrR family transcriptional regulator